MVWQMDQWMVGWLFDWLAGSMDGWWIDRWMVSWLDQYMCGWLEQWWLFDWLFGSMKGSMNGWLNGWLVDWMNWLMDKQAKQIRKLSKSLNIYFNSNIHLDIILNINYIRLINCKLNISLKKFNPFLWVQTASFFFFSEGNALYGAWPRHLFFHFSLHLSLSWLSCSEMHVIVLNSLMKIKYRNLI